MSAPDFDAALIHLTALEALSVQLRRRIQSHPNLEADKARRLSMLFTMRTELAMAFNELGESETWIDANREE